MTSDLYEHPERYEFFQLVRLLERTAAADQRTAVGSDTAPEHEFARFSVHPGLSHPAGEVTRVTSHKDGPPGIEVSFMGLTGPNGVLPDHYTSLILNRIRANDSTLREFLDLFHHRVLSMFYRASGKYRFAFGYRTSREDGHTDDFTFALRSLTGQGTDGLSNRSAADPAVLQFAGLFSRSVRSAESLRAVLATYFELPIRILQFTGQWLRLSADQQTQLRIEPGQFNRLGQDTVIGERVFDVQSRFSVLVGPVDQNTFRRFLPDRSDLKDLCQLVRRFVGTEFDFDVRFVLPPDQVPGTTLGGHSDHGSRLGWNTWLSSRPFTQQVDDAVFLLANV